MNNFYNFVANNWQMLAPLAIALIVITTIYARSSSLGNAARFTLFIAQLPFLYELVSFTDGYRANIILNSPSSIYHFVAILLFGFVYFMASCANVSLAAYATNGFKNLEREFFSEGGLIIWMFIGLIFGPIGGLYGWIYDGSIETIIEFSMRGFVIGFASGSLIGWLTEIVERNPQPNN